MKKQTITSVSRALKIIKKAKLNKTPQFQNFVSVYLNDVPEREFRDISDEHILAHLTHAFAFFQKPHTKKVRNINVFNPSWCKHSVIEVSTPDHPFLIDTIWLELQRRGYHIHHSIHPVIHTVRLPCGTLSSCTKANANTEVSQQNIESFVHIEFDRQGSKKELAHIAKTIEETLKNVLTSIQDFPHMMEKLRQIILHTEHAYKATPQREENLAFLHWLIAENFIFLGYRHYDITYNAKQTYLQTTKKSGYGVLKQDKQSSVFKKTPLTNLAYNLQTYFKETDFLTITKTLNKSRIHRHTTMDYIGIKEFDSKGRITGEHRFVGLFTSKAYTTRSRHIPIVGSKIRAVLKKFGDESSVSHNYKSLVNILETYPKDELLQISTDDLYRISTGILHLQERHQVRLFARHSNHENFVTALVFLPTEIMNSQLRLKIQDILLKEYGGTALEFQLTMGASSLVQLFFKIYTSSNTCKLYDDEKIEQKLITAARGWNDNLRHALIENYREETGLSLYKTYKNAFSLGYQEQSSAQSAIKDIDTLEHMKHTGNTFALRLDLTNPKAVRLRLFQKNGTIHLSTVMPLFNNLGLTITTEHPHKITVHDKNITLHDFEVLLQDDQCIDTNRAKTLIEALTLAWQENLENDRLNALILAGGLTVRQIIILRAYVAYLRQTAQRYSQGYIRDTLVKHANIALLLSQLFDARFDPSLKQNESNKQQKKYLKKLTEALKNVSVLDEDRILQTLTDTIIATLRTNAWQNTNQTDPLAFKINSEKIPDLIKPVPWREIFVYHPTVEGVHLRGGAVARGGLRWSDRPADFRTEVLGLMKAQMTKNTVIVPTGSKGGFILKQVPQNADRETMMHIVETAYRTFIRSLLSITDNRIGSRIVPPVKVKCYDKPDPYLVVAADKGTATFSDIANEEAINARYWRSKNNGFWLGDAFASGGSQGYDHKAMGITARGAWESVKHHFRLLNKNIQKENITVVGIGDMGGDVFGNGMLLSKHICLVGAFNHLHIFIDPTPNPAQSWKERQRLFKKVKGWGDYNEKKLSQGGRIFDRNAKELTLTPEIKKIFHITKNKVTPNELMKAMLLAPIDLIWNGGIGTFIKSTQESHQEVADRTNDDIRINGKDVRAKVIGEGGNLGITQLGRVEYALNGGLINTDALDNSAGVATSDKEVNIKILLQIIQQKTSLSSNARNTLLASMTDEVGHMVLRDNYLQNQAITLKEKEGVNANDTNELLMRHLVQEDLLDPVIEFLPNAEEVDSRARNNKGFTRPELAVLLAYAKFDLYENLVKSTLPDSPVLKDYLTNYFPIPLQKKYSSHFLNHPLKREIIATTVTNELVNRMGLTFLNRMRSETGYSGAEVAKAFVVAKILFEADKWWQSVETLDYKVAAKTQIEMYNAIKRVVGYGTFWILRNSQKPFSISHTLKRYQNLFENITRDLEKFQTKGQQIRLQHQISVWKQWGVDAGLAHAFSLLPELLSAPDIASLALSTQKSVSTIMPLHFLVGERLKLAELKVKVRHIPVENNWQRVASAAILDEIYTYQKRISYSILTQHKNNFSANAMLKNWIEKRANAIEQYDQLASELTTQSAPTHAMMTVLLSQIKGLVK